MSSPCILIIDTDPKTFLLLQTTFQGEQVQLYWVPEVSSLRQSLPNHADVGIVLFGVQQALDYETAYEIHHRFDSAVMFILTEQQHYDAFEARNAGAVGTFVKPLNVVHVYQRLIELLPDTSIDATGQLDKLSMPVGTERQAKLLSFVPSSPVQDDLEALVADLLPVVVEQVLQVQLSVPSPFQKRLQEYIQQAVQEAIASSTTSSNDRKPSP